MDKKRFAAEAAALIVIAVLCATIANAVAARSRTVAWRADYPNALTVPRAPTPAPARVPGDTSVQSESQILLPVPGVTPSAAAPQPEATRPAPTAVEPQLAPAPSPVASIAAAPSPKVFPPHPEKPWIEISPEDVAELYGRKILFIDARRTDVFNEGHIAGSRSMPVWEADVDARVAALYDEGRDQNAPIVIYCSGGNCEDSHMLAQKLWGVGFDNVLVYKDGFPDWQKRGGAVARGATQ